MFDEKAPNATVNYGKKSQRSCEVAIIGLSGRFPGGANSPDELWETLMSGRDAVGELTGDRWSLGWHNPDPGRTGRVHTKACGLLDRIDGFDAEFFGISPREAQQIDPQQRLLLELAWEAFEDAGIPPRGAAGENIGVYIGISSNDYAQMASAGVPDAYTNTGVALSIAANRMSYVFDLRGPSFAVDTACSSSLVCVHQACQAIQRGECDAALAGGVNILIDIRPWQGFSRASMLSPDGRCKSFDESGNGYVRSEGGGLVLLKRLEDAERDGDNILGVIRGTGINSDGRTLGLSMPNGDAQTALLSELYSETGIAPEEVFYVEAHGTGTSVGDPIECSALGAVLGAPRSDGSRCHIGSVKSNIGHLESASGIAGMAKIIMAMKHRMVPANLHFNKPNPKIAFDEWKLQVVDQPLPFPDEPVVMGINSFGFGGTNAHAIVAEYRKTEVADAAVPTPAHLVISASSTEALQELARGYAKLLRAPGADFAAIANAAAVCRSPLRMRLAVAASSATDAADKLDSWLAEDRKPGTMNGTAEAGTVPTAFVYSGNGPQWWGMGRDLLSSNATFRAVIEEIDAVFTPLAGWALIDEMARPESESRIALTEVAQPMLFALQMGLTEVFRKSGIVPSAVFGHSVGEVAAACASGALSLNQATEVIFHRSSAQSQTAGLGKMAALGLDVDAARAAIAKVGGWLEIAAVNSPNAVTVAGDEVAVAKLVAQVSEDGKFARLLKLDYPFHTKAMEPIRDELLTALQHVTPATAAVPFISTVTGKQEPGDKLTADYWYDNVRQPVHFSQAVMSGLTEHGIGLFIEIGPHPVLKDYVTQGVRSAGMMASAIETLRRPGKDRPESDDDNLADVIAAAFANGAVDLTATYMRPATLPKLPSYPWQRQRHWRGAVGLPDSFVPVSRDHPLLGARMPNNDALWEMVMDKNSLSYLEDHVVQNAIVFPAAGYVELMLSAARLQWGEDRIIDLENVQVMRPLVLTDQADPIVHTSIDSRDSSVEISSRRDRDTKEHQVHVRGRMSLVEDMPMQKVDVAEMAARLPVIVSGEAHYEGARARGLQYGPFFQGIETVRLSAPDAPRREALATVRLDLIKDSALGAYRSHPTLFDSCIQAMLPLVSQLDQRNVSTIPVYFDRTRSFAPLPADMLCHVEIIRESARSAVVQFKFMDMDGTVVMTIDGARCQKANLTGEAISPLTSEWWRPDTKVVFTGSLPPLTVPEQVHIASAGSTDVVSKLDQIATLYAVRALDEIRQDQPEFTMGSLAKAARIGRAQGPLLKQVLDMAEAGGFVRGDGRSWTWEGQDRPEVEAVWAESFRAHPAHQAAFLLAMELGDSLPARLRGEDVPEPNTTLLEQLTDHAPIAADINQLAVATLDEIVRNWPADRPMRILEVGGGTGGLTSWILPILPSERVDYLLTDESEALIAKAERRLSAHPFLRTAAVDLTEDLGAQGLPTGYFDLVIGSGLARLGDGLTTHLRSLKKVMADGARLLAIAPQTGAFAALVHGAQAVVTQDVLRESGFGATSVLSAGSATLCVGTHVAVASATAATVEAKPERHLILAENPAGFAEKLQASLESLGHTASIMAFPPTPGQAATDAIQDALNMSEASRVVLLADAQTDQSTLLQVQSTRSLTAVAVVGAMELMRQDRDCGLTIVTRGAFVTANGTGPVDPAEAALWGVGRVIENEHSGLDIRLIDLHAAQADQAEAQCLAAEISRRDAETEVQLVAGHRYVNRERFTQPADEARQAGLTAEHFALDFVPQGGLNSLHLRALSRRDPAEDEVEIAVKAAGLNFRDVLWCMGMLPEEAVEHGFSGPTIGMECAGEVVRVGAGVQHLQPGDRVMAFASSCFGTHVTTAAKSVAKMPENMAFSEAATVPTVFLTAWYGLDYLARLEPGETILIHGAAGGVGLAAIQIAKQKGAIVIGTAGSAMKRRMLSLLGVDHVLNSRTLEYADQVMEITDGKGVDVILNSLAGEAILKNLNCLRPFGRFLEIGKRDLYENSRIGLRPFRNNLSYFGIDADTLLIERPALAQRLFNEVIAQFATGELTPLPHQIVPISRASEAFRAMQQSRHVGKLVVSMELDRSQDLCVVRARDQVRPGGTYLVTGGLAGFGLATARWLAERGADSLALVSRSGASSDEAKAALAAFEASGVSVRAFAVDIADPQQVSVMLSTIRAEMAPLIGVIHSAAVIEDAPILNMTAEQVARVFLPKMVGAWNLHQATQQDPIEMFVLYSSSSAVVGNPGQGAYVAANLYLDALAQHRRSIGLPALSIGWGAIKDAGFLTRHENVRDMLKSRTGLDATPAQEALADLGRASAAGASRVSVARFDLQRLHQMLPVARGPRFQPILPNDASASLQADETLADTIKGLPKSEQRQFILARILESTARVLGTSASQINPQQPLGDLGLDSLMAVELAGSIERDVGQSIPVMQLLGADSLMAVVDFVGKILGVDDADGESAADTSSADDTDKTRNAA